MKTRGRDSAESLMTVVEMSGERPGAPEKLNEAERRLWTEIVDSLPADYFRPADLPMLAAYCTACIMFDECAKALRDEKFTYTNERGNVCKNPAHDMLRDHATILNQLGKSLRLCPSSRYSEKKASGLHGENQRRGRPWETAA